MYVRLTHFSIPTEKIEEIKKVYYEEIAPVIGQQPGIVNVLLYEPLSGNEEFISATTWKSEADTKAFESSDSYKVVFGKIREATLNPPVQKYFQLVD